MLNRSVLRSHRAMVRCLVSVLLGKHGGVGGVGFAHGIVGLDLLMWLILLVIWTCIAFVIPIHRFIQVKSRFIRWEILYYTYFCGERLNVRNLFLRSCSLELNCSFSRLKF